MPIKHLQSIGKGGSGTSSSAKRPPWKAMVTSAAVLAGIVILIGFFILTLALAWFSRDLPNPNALLERDVAQSTKIYDRTGEVLLYEIHGDEQRTLVTIDQIPDVMKWATVSIEDKDFYKHHGVSWKGLFRAFLTSAIKRQRVQGTSTLTQQFVKNAVLTNERSVARKLKELLLSLQIERKYTKDQILQLYLNEIPYGSTLYGVESASQGYFGKSVRDIALDEAALLAALPQSPSRYNPYGTGSRGDSRELLVGRQWYVLDQMAEQGYITKEQAEEAKNIDTLAKLVPRQVGNIKAPHFVMMVREQLADEFGQRAVETGGLKVLTTLDWRLQQEAERIVREYVDAKGEIYRFSNASLVAIGPRDGQIIAMVGSKDFFNEEIDGQVNVALRPRQPGSSFKPIVYALGFQKGYTPDTVLWDVKTSFKTDVKDYTPANYDLKERGPISVRLALQGSLNIPAVKMLYLTGVGSVLDFAEQLGYTTFGDRSRFGLSLVLGGGEVTLLEHTAAFGAFAAEGVLHPTTAILKVEGAKGEALKEWTLGEGKKVMDAQIARLLSNVLSDNAARAYVFGANNNLTLPGRPVAAKTGTTNSYRDAWTMGYTPSLAVGVWAGNNDNSEMIHGSGGSMAAAPIWQQFMKAATKDTPVESFTPPSPPDTTKEVLLGKAFEQTVKIDTVTGKLATEYTPPEYVEEKVFREAHSILHYVNKDDPKGPVPTNPAADPQYNRWESAVYVWVQDPKNEWSATGTAPTEYDDVHTKENIPAIRVQSPVRNDRMQSRSFSVRAEVYAPRTIRSVRALMENYVIGTSYQPSNGNEWSFIAALPNAIEKGFHDVVIEARDDVGNVGRETLTINLLADPEPLLMSFVDLPPGTILGLDAFPKRIYLQVNDLSAVVRADLRLESPSGENRLIGSNIKPQENPVEFQWSYVQGPGVYTLYAIVTDENGRTIESPRINISVTPPLPE